MRLLEKDVEKSILQYLEFLPGCYAWKNQSVGVFDPARKVFRKSKNKYAINGTSDILGVYKGRFLAIEVKSPDNKDRPDHQKQFIETVLSNGGIAFFADSVECVKEKLRENS